MSEKYNYCHIAEMTDVGCKRKANEDWLSHFESPNGLVAVVCDGMGGHVGGQIASHTAVEAIEEFMMVERTESPAELIIQAIDAANEAVLRRATQQPELTGMGSTCVMLIVRDGKVYIGSVGDSRVYLIRNHRIRQLTVDQSYVQMLVDSGAITHEDAERHPRKNEITNAIGLSDMQPATVLPDAISPVAGDCFLLCSDGLSGMVSDHDIEKVVSRQSENTQQERVEELVYRARRNGGLDNITCQIVEFAITPGQQDKPTERHHRWLLPLAALAALVLIAGGAWWCAHRNHAPQHSERVIRLMATCDSIYTMQQTEYQPGKVLADMQIDRQLEGMKLNVHQPTGDTTIVLRNFAFKSVVVTPEQAVVVTYNTDSTQCLVQFARKPEAEQEVTITLVGADKSYMYIIPLPPPAPQVEPSSEKNAKPSDKVKDDPATKKQPTDKSTDTTDKSVDTTAASGKSIKSNSSVMTAKTDYQIRVPADKAHHMITLLSREGTSTDNRIYLKDYAFMAKNGDRGWYTIRNDGAVCAVVVKNTADNPVPEKKDAVIRIPTRPDCNNGQGIILRIHLVK